MLYFGKKSSYDPNLQCALWHSIRAYLDTIEMALIHPTCVCVLYWHHVRIKLRLCIKVKLHLDTSKKFSPCGCYGGLCVCLLSIGHSSKYCCRIANIKLSFSPYNCGAVQSYSSSRILSDTSWIHIFANPKRLDVGSPVS